MLKKLKHKTPHEIFYRVRKMLKARKRERNYSAEKVAAKIAALSVVNDKSTFLNNVNRPQFFFNSDRNAARETFRRDFADDIEKTLERADKILQNKFTMLGSDFSYNKNISWHHDPVSRREYNRNYYKRVDIFSDDGKSDIKYVWEVNRHQYFIDVAKAYFATGDEKYARYVVETFNDWIEQNPYLTGVNWASALEISVRSYAWIWSYYLLLDSDLIDEEFTDRFSRAMYVHGEFLFDHLSFYFSPYNHLIGEASALFTIGYMFPEFAESKKWAAKGWQILVDELPKQFHPDGLTVEQASFYHYFTLGFYLMPVVLRQQNGDSVPGRMLNHLEQIFNFSQYLTRPDGSTPWVGDIDNARSIYFTDPETWDFRNFLAMGAIMFGSAEFKHAAGRNWEDVLWLFGAKRAGEYANLEARPPAENLRNFDASGHAIGRSGWGPEDHYFRFDCGEIADGVFRDETKSAAHGHADILNFELTAYGQNFIVDPGFHNYRGKVAWHEYFRETHAHNCLLVDGQSQAKHGGILEWSNRSDPRVLDVQKHDQVFYYRGTHDAFRMLDGNVEHRRNFLYINNDIWIVVDEVDGSGEHLVESYLHLMPSTVKHDKQLLTVSRNSVDLNILHLGDEMGVEIREGGEKPEDGWLAPLYRQSMTAPVVRFHQKTQLPLLQYLILVPDNQAQFRIEDQSEDQVSFVSNKASYTIRIRKGLKAEGALLEVQWDGENANGVRLAAKGNSGVSLEQFESTLNKEAKTT